METLHQQGSTSHGDNCFESFGKCHDTLDQTAKDRLMEIRNASTIMMPPSIKASEAGEACRYIRVGRLSKFHMGTSSIRLKVGSYDVSAVFFTLAWKLYI